MLPAESFVADQMAVADPEAVRVARRTLRRQLGNALRPGFEQVLRECAPGGPWRATPAEISRRSLAHVLLDLLAEAGGDFLTAFAHRQYAAADNMGDQLAALRAMVNGGLAGADDLLERFHTQWQHEALVIDQWFSLQVGSPAIDAVARARRLLVHPQFELTNPNRVRALIGAFCGNAAAFHRADGAGYRFLAEQVIALDRVNPQIAARLAGAFGRWRRVDPARQALAASAMQGILDQPALSPNVYEVVHKARFDGAG